MKGRPTSTNHAQPLTVENKTVSWVF